MFYVLSAVIITPVPASLDEVNEWIGFHLSCRSGLSEGNPLYDHDNLQACTYDVSLLGNSPVGKLPFCAVEAEVDSLISESDAFGLLDFIIENSDMASKPEVLQKIKERNLRLKDKALVGG